MNALETVKIQCPYCWEIIEIVVDSSAGNQSYVEDCEVCCRPISLNISIDEDERPIVDASREDEL